MTILVFLICFAASLAGGLVGIGGGVIIKPLLDMLGLMPVPTLSFLSGLTVLAMALVSTWRNRHSGHLNTAIGLPLGAGAALGGVGGKLLFDLVKQAVRQPTLLGSIQAVVLSVMVLGTILYILLKHRISSHRIQNKFGTMVIGLALGLISAFLGIGGGPMNLAVLYYFFSLDAKGAAVNSLLVILFSQTASLLFTLLTGNVPPFDGWVLAAMVVAGVLGGTLAARLLRTVNEKQTEKLVLITLVGILVICLYNAVKG